MRILFTSNILLDTDIGVYRLVREKYDNTKYFKLNILDVIIERYKEVIPRRDTINPLSFIIKDEYKNSIDNLYNEMMSKDYSRILELSEFTNVEDVLGLFLTRKELDIKIVCKNLEEKQIFKNRNKKYNIVVFENYKDIDVEPYDAIYTKYYKDYSKFNKIVAKTLYFANAKYNFTNKNIIDPEIYINLDGPNEFKAINLY